VEVEQKWAIYQNIEQYYDNNSNDDEDTIDINSTCTHVVWCLSNMNEDDDTSSSSLSLSLSSLDTIWSTTLWYT